MNTALLSRLAAAAIVGTGLLGLATGAQARGRHGEDRPPTLVAPAVVAPAVVAPAPYTPYTRYVPSTPMAPYGYLPPEVTARRPPPAVNLSPYGNGWVVDSHGNAYNAEGMNNYLQLRQQAREEQEHELSRESP